MKFVLNGRADGSKKAMARRTRPHGKRRLHVSLAGGKASFPSLTGKDAGAAIVLVTFALGRDKVSARLDVQKQMFIDKIPETLDTRETAQAISRVIRAA
jgi:hypothetical protein